MLAGPSKVNWKPALPCGTQPGGWRSRGEGHYNQKVGTQEELVMATAEAKLHVAEFTNEPFIDFTNAENRKRMEAALAKVKAEFGHEYPMWIAGQKVITTGKKKSTNPS